MRLFADDCLIYRVIDTPNDCERLQNDMNTLVNWADRWQMSFNTSKCHLLRITRKQSPILRSYKMGTDVLSDVKHHPYLGVELAHNLEWRHHIDNVYSKCSRTIYFLQRNLSHTPEEVKRRAYIAYVRPIAEYSSSIWDPHHKCDINKIEKIQRHAARFVCKDYRRRSSVTQMLKILKWPTLQERRCVTRLTVLYKIQHGIVAITIPPYVQRSSRQTRSGSSIQLATKSDVYLYSFFPRTLSMWNKLTMNLTESDTVESFVCKIWDAIHTGVIKVVDPKSLIANVSSQTLLVDTTNSTRYIC